MCEYIYNALCMFIYICMFISYGNPYKVGQFSGFFSTGFLFLYVSLYPVIIFKQKKINISSWV